MMCCGLPMAYLDVFGIRVWSCTYRHHPQVFENLQTGQRIRETKLTRTRSQAAGECDECDSYTANQVVNGYLLCDRCLTARAGAGN